MKITHFKKKKGNNKTLISQRPISNFGFCRHQLGFKDRKPLISSIKIRSIGRRHLRSQDQDRSRKHFLSQDQIHWSQTLTQSRSRSWSQTSPQLRLDPLVAGIYVAKIKIVVADISSVKIIIGRKHLHSQDSFCRHLILYP